VDTNDYAKPPVDAKPPRRERYHNDEFKFLQSVANHDLKIPVTGAYTIAVWSYDEHYGPQTGRIGAGHGRNEELTARRRFANDLRSEEHTSELQSQSNLVCRLLLEKKKKQ